MTGLRAFREAYVTAGMEGFDGDAAYASVYDFQSVEARQVRYDILWAYYQGNAYRTIHAWAQAVKSTYGLYTHIRDIFNPANRICNFHQSHIWGGHLDPDAGDGSEVPTALPIENAANNVQNAVAQLWRNSKFLGSKDIITLHGSVFGDVFLKVVDDPFKEIVYIDRLHPAWVVDMRKDRLGNITYYELAYSRLDPLSNNGKTVTYGEKAILDEDSGLVTYQTMRDNRPFAWDGREEEWTVEYGFIPVRHIQHNDVGLDWGWSELFPKLSTFRELDDQASKLGDQVRKMVDSPWFISGVRVGKDGGTVTVQGLDTQNTNDKALSQEETPLLYAHDPGAKASPMVAPLSIADTLSHIQEVQAEVERSYPELRTAQLRGGRSGDVSGRALLIARQEAEDKVEQRRTGYDTGLIDVHRMAIAIGGDAKYDGFDGFKLEDWNKDATEHRIKSQRPVFRPHPTERLDQEQAFWTNAALANRVGVGLEVFLRDKDWDPERIKQVLESEFYKLFLDRLEAEAVVAEGSESDGSPESDVDRSGRGAPTGGQDFDVATIQETEG